MNKLHNSIIKDKYKLRPVRITYNDGSIIETNINGNDKEIKEYYRKGRTFNIGNSEFDKIVKVKKLELLDKK